MSKKLTTAFLLLALWPMLALAVPNSIRFQGRLTDRGHAPFPGTSTVIFDLFLNATGGSSLWTSGPVSVTANAEGLFATDINSVPPGILAQYPQLYLQVTVQSFGGPQILMPRQKLTSVPYAIEAGHAASADVASSLANSAITSDQLVDGAVTSVKLSSNSVNSIHIIDGAITSLDLASNAVRSSNIQNGTIESVDLSTSAVTGDNVLNGSIEGEDIAPGTVGPTNILNGYSLLPAGAIVLWTGGICPAGFSRFTGLDGLFPMGGAAYTGVAKGSSSIDGLVVVSSGAHSHAHTHTIANDSPGTSSNGNHQHATPIALHQGGAAGAYVANGTAYNVHPQAGPFGVRNNGLPGIVDPITAYTFAAYTTQGTGAYAWAATSTDGNHFHTVNSHSHGGNTGPATSTTGAAEGEHVHRVQPLEYRPPYMEILFCQKN